MTEPGLRELFVGIEGLRAGMVQRASDTGEDADSVHRLHDDLAEWLLAAMKGIPVPDKAISAMRLRLAALESRLLQRGLDEAAAAEGIERLVGPARAAADTLEIELDDIARGRD